MNAAGPIPYAPAPSDSYWTNQWYLENIGTDGIRRGIDLNARTAWSISRGEGVTIAIVDDGVELNHPDLASQADPSLHWNFETSQPVGHHGARWQNHGTPVAGLAIAQGDDGRGITGIAPEARFASWIVYNTNLNNGTFVNSTQMANMFQFKIQEVQVQNHSWVQGGLVPVRLTHMSEAEHLAISNAVTLGRGGRGVVIVRAAGNNRENGRNANEDAYTADPRVIAVGALGPFGQVASYSTPGTPVLIAAPGGNTTEGSLFTTDRVGTAGLNYITFPSDPDLNNYVGDIGGVGSILAFTGTSGSAPLVSGIAALILSANPELTYRDVQHILVHSAYQTDPFDVELKQNGAGFWVSDNTGYGLVNAGTAVDLARNWVSRPEAVQATATAEIEQAIPDAALRVQISSPGGVPAPLDSIPAIPSLGRHAMDRTAKLPLVYVGQASEPLQMDLTGKAALIQRGGGTFVTKLAHAANAGAEFAIIFNNTGGTELQFLGNTINAPIPAASISQNHGEAILNLITNAATGGVEAEIVLRTVSYEFEIAESLSTEHVQVHLDVTHAQRGDLRVTLVSPSGTRSVLQRFGPDESAVDETWTYMSTHHFYEPSVGTWRLYLSDEGPGGTGVAHGAALEIHGTPITDGDADGLDDVWEADHFGSLAQTLAADPDNDGYSNAREQILGSDPAENQIPLEVDLSQFSDSIVRLNWPSRNGTEYDILGTASLDQPFEVIGTAAGGFPRAAWFGPNTGGYRFFSVRERAD